MQKLFIHSQATGYTVATSPATNPQAAPNGRKQRPTAVTAQQVQTAVKREMDKHLAPLINAGYVPDETAVLTPIPFPGLFDQAAPVVNAHQQRPLAGSPAGVNINDLQPIIAPALFGGAS